MKTIHTQQKAPKRQQKHHKPTHPTHHTLKTDATPHHSQCRTMTTPAPRNKFTKRVLRKTKSDNTTTTSPTTLGTHTQPTLPTTSVHPHALAAYRNAVQWLEYDAKAVKNEIVPKMTRDLQKNGFSWVYNPSTTRLRVQYRVGTTTPVIADLSSEIQWKQDEVENPAEEVPEEDKYSEEGKYVWHPVKWKLYVSRPTLANALEATQLSLKSTFGTEKKDKKNEKVSELDPDYVPALQWTPPVGSSYLEIDGDLHLNTDVNLYTLTPFLGTDRPTQKVVVNRKLFSVLSSAPKSTDPADPQTTANNNNPDDDATDKTLRMAAVIDLNLPPEQITDGGLDELFQMAETTVFAKEAGSVVVEIARQCRVKSHVESLEAIADFFKNADIPGLKTALDGGYDVTPQEAKH